MKKIVLILSVLLLAVVGNVNAQKIDKGSKSIMGNLTGLDFAVGIDEKTDNFNLGVGVNGMYFVADNLAIVGGVGYSLQHVEGVSENTLSYTAGIRPYFLNHLFVGGYYEGLTSVNVKNYHNALKVDAGITYYISSKVFVEPSVYYRYGLGDTYDLSKIGLSIAVGFDL